MTRHDTIAPCACGAEPPLVWAYSHVKVLIGVIRWHVLCKVCHAEVIACTKRRALHAWSVASAKPVHLDRSRPETPIINQSQMGAQ